VCVLIVRRKFGLNCKMFFFSIKTKTKNKDKHIIFFNTRNRNSLKVLRIDYRIGHWRTTDYLMFPMIGGPLFLVLFINICQNIFSFKYSLLIAQFWNTSIKICTGKNPLFWLRSMENECMYKICTQKFYDRKAKTSSSSCHGWLHQTFN
jgi:hypothetical protein